MQSANYSLSVLLFLLVLLIVDCKLFPVSSVYAEKDSIVLRTIITPIGSQSEKWGAAGLMVCIGGGFKNQGGCGPTDVNAKDIDGALITIDNDGKDKGKLIIFKDDNSNHEFDDGDIVYELGGKGKDDGDFEGLIQGSSFETGEWETLGKLSHFEVGADTIRALDTEGYRYGIHESEYDGKKYRFVTKKKYGDPGSAEIIGDFYTRSGFENIRMKNDAGNFCSICAEKQLAEDFCKCRGKKLIAYDKTYVSHRPCTKIENCICKKCADWCSYAIDGIVCASGTYNGLRIK